MCYIRSDFKGVNKNFTKKISKKHLGPRLVLLKRFHTYYTLTICFCCLKLLGRNLLRVLEHEDVFKERPSSITHFQY